jgi:hypothetical protein
MILGRPLCTPMCLSGCHVSMNKTTVVSPACLWKIISRAISSPDMGLGHWFGLLQDLWSIESYLSCFCYIYPYSTICDLILQTIMLPQRCISLLNFWDLDPIWKIVMAKIDKIFNFCNMWTLLSFPCISRIFSAKWHRLCGYKFLQVTGKDHAGNGFTDCEFGKNLKHERGNM